MKALVVYESQFGNTAGITRAVAEGLAQGAQVDVLTVGGAPTSAAGYDLVVVGGPTHAFGLSRASTRANARQQGAHEMREEDEGLREWLARLEHCNGTRWAAAFDTKIARPRVPGSAANAAERRLRRMGFAILAPAVTFYVEDVDGPLLSGELTRASDWGAELQAALHGRAVPHGRSRTQGDALAGRRSRGAVRRWN